MKPGTGIINPWCSYTAVLSASPLSQGRGMLVTSRGLPQYVSKPILTDTTAKSKCFIDKIIQRSRKKPPAMSNMAGGFLLPVSLFELS